MIYYIIFNNSSYNYYVVKSENIKICGIYGWITGMCVSGALITRLYTRNRTWIRATQGCTLAFGCAGFLGSVFLSARCASIGQVAYRKFGKSLPGSKTTVSVFL